MIKPDAVLKKYWGYTSFRPLQKEIIENIVAKKNTIALLATAAGKSICFQVPAMMQQGICIVISPLHALIKDQVNQLQAKDIKAIGLDAGLSFSSLDMLLDNCIYGGVKFLYLSPERLQQKIVIERIAKMTVQSIVIDEAHCISQWGHDFRPSFQEIYKIRSFLPNIPVVALTGSATSLVLKDIKKHLKIEDATVFKASFARPNIGYLVYQVENKKQKLLQILKRLPHSTAIVYMRTRRGSVEIAHFLQQQGFAAAFFHGALTNSDKEKALQDWMQEKTKIMVATNAFGMGINKENVRLVIHLEIPENLESYYQEAGRAGRDGTASYAIILKKKQDITQAKDQFLATLADTSFTKTVYLKLTQYFRIPYAEGTNQSYALDFSAFCKQYQLPSIKTYNALKHLERNGILLFSKDFAKATRIVFTLTNQQLFYYLEKHPKAAVIIQSILRSYAGVFDIATAIDIEKIAKKNNTIPAYINQLLEQLQTDGIVNYQQKSTDATITFLTPREDAKTIAPIQHNITDIILQKKKQLQAVLDYIENDQICKSIQLLSYFEQQNTAPCGSCSVCLQKVKKTPKQIQLLIQEQILALLQKRPCSSLEITEKLPYKETAILEVLAYLIEYKKIALNPINTYYIP